MVVIRVRLDPGHGGPDPGATANGLRESDVALGITKLVAAMLRSQDIAIDLTRVADVELLSGDRSAHLKRPGVACSVSIHANAAGDPGAAGHEIFVSAFLDESRRLGELISEEYLQWVQGIGARQPAVKTRLASGGAADYYYFVRHPVSVGIPAVLVEVGFVTNQQDAAVLASFWGRFQIAYAISRGILSWLGVDSDQRLSDLERELASAYLDLADARARLSQIAILAAQKGGE